MKSSGILWTIAVVLALVFSAWQRVSGPTYPIYGHATLAGTAFGRVGRNHLRFSYATSRENIVEAVKRMRGVVEPLAAAAGATR